MNTDTLTILSVMRDSLPPTRPDVLTLFGKDLVKSGITSLLVGQYGEAKEVQPWPGGKTYGRGQAGGMLSTVLTPFWDLVGVLWAFRENSIHCVQARDKIFSGITCHLVARLTGVPFVYWMSFPIVEGHRARARAVGKSKGWLVWLANNCRAAFSRWAFYRLVLPGADHLFVQSEAMREWLAGKGIDPARMTAVPMGVDTERLRRERIVPAEDARLDGRRVIAYVGVLGKDRNSTFLLDLVLALLPFEAGIVLVLAGDADAVDERQWIREEIARRNLQEHVLLTGWLGQEQALRYAIRAEVGLSPIPRGELFDVSSPTKLVEYLALGIPGVANDIPDQKLLIERSQAGFCVPMEIDAFRDAVLRLLRDEGLRRECAERGPAFVRNERAYPILAQRVARAYREIVRKKENS
jgi:glycosyltransferase involved in cell wall biosynthesis